MSQPPYLTWSISEERQRHEWLRVRRSIMAVRMAFLVGGHVVYFALLGLAYLLGRFNAYGHSFWVGLWSMGLIGVALFIMEMAYTHLVSTAVPRFAIRKNGLTHYGADGPCAHYDWTRTRILHIENDRHRPEFRSLILTEPRRFRWMRRAGRIAIPLPTPGHSGSETLDETHVVDALRQAIEDNGMTWRTCASGEIVLM